MFCVDDTDLKNSVHNCIRNSGILLLFQFTEAN